MRSARYFLSGLLVLLMASAVLGQRTGPATRPSRDAPRKVRSPLRGHWRMVAREVKLTDEQVGVLVEKIKARDAALSAWEAEKGQKLRDLRAQARKAREAKDAEQAKLLAEQVKSLRDEKRELQQKYNVTTALKAMMTPGQNASYEGLILYRGALGEYRTVALSEEQKTAIRALCTKVGVEVAALKGDDVKGRAKLRAQLLKSVHDKVLTGEQKLQSYTSTLSRTAMQACRRVGVSDEQKAKVEAMAKKVAAEMVKAETPAAAKELTVKFLNAVFDEVLTAEQRAKVRRSGAGRPKRKRPTTQPAEKKSD